MWKTSKWKVVAGAATLSALGISGLAMADQSNPSTQEAIHLRDQVQSTEATVRMPDLTPGPVVAGFGDLDSPFDDSNGTDSSIDNSVGSSIGDMPTGVDTGDDASDSGLESGIDNSILDSASDSDDVIAPLPSADDSLDSASGTFDSLDSASGS